MDITIHAGYGFNYIDGFSTENIKEFAKNKAQQEKLLLYQKYLNKFTQNPIDEETQYINDTYASDYYLKWIHLNSHFKDEQYGIYFPNISRIIDNDMSEQQITPKRANILLANLIACILRYFHFIQNNYKEDNFYPDSKLLVDFVNFLNTKYDFASFIAINYAGENND